MNESDPSSYTTTACIAGGGPAGAMLALLLARAGVDTMLLEKYGDFHRDFRGDSVHPATLEILDELGLIDKLERLPHQKVTTLGIIENHRKVLFGDFSDLKTPYPYMVIVPQWEFLDLITSEAARYPNFRLLMNAEVHDLVRDANGRAAGVHFRGPDGERTVHANLTIAADGRHSVLRRAAGLKLHSFGAPTDIVNFPLSHKEGDPTSEGVDVYILDGKALTVIDRGTYWQIAYEVMKVGPAGDKAYDLETIRKDVAAIAPFLADRVDEIADLKPKNFLEIRIDRLAKRWHQPGLVFIGDSAHAMSGLGGFGVNLAIQDAVATANLLAEKLLRCQETGELISDRALASVRRRRLYPAAGAQAFQRMSQRQGLEKAMKGKEITKGANPFNAITRYKSLQKFMGWITGIGLRPEHVHSPTQDLPITA